MRPLLCVAAVLLAQAASAEKILIGQLSTLAHSVSGEVYALDEKTLMIKDFNYDGAGPDAFFWVSTEGSNPSNVQNEAATKILAYPYTDPGYYEYRDQAAPVLPAAANQQITLRLPGEMKVGDLKWLSVWCRRYSVDFGNLIFPANLNLPKSGDIPHPLAPVDNSVAEPEPEAEAEAEPEHDHDHHDHDHDHSYDHNHVGAEPESEPSAESEPEPDSGATVTAATSLATLAAMLLAAVFM